MKESNVLKGRNSKDAIIDGQVVAFINRNSSEYPVEVGAGFFAPVQIEKEKDIALNVAKEHAKQEYERIMEMVHILQEQAKQLVDRLDATELVHGAEFGMIVTHSKPYFLYFDSIKNKNILSSISPITWCAGPPYYYKFVASVQKKGDSTWEYIDEDSVSN
jgi:hypothetical protein